MLTKRKLVFLTATACVVLSAAGVAVATTGVEHFVVGYNVIMGTHGADDLRGGPGDDLLASEGAWGSSPEDTAPDTIHGAGGDDLVDTVSDPPFRDVVRCGAGRDEVQADPEDEVDEDCEIVQRIDLSKGPRPPKGTPKYITSPE
jgi:RTX calcium-binding nonapeptide repeat (4 copies)